MYSVRKGMRIIHLIVWLIFWRKSLYCGLWGRHTPAPAIVALQFANVGCFNVFTPRNFLVKLRFDEPLVIVDITSHHKLFRHLLSCTQKVCELFPDGAARNNQRSRDSGKKWYNNYSSFNGLCLRIWQVGLRLYSFLKRRSRRFYCTVCPACFFMF